MPTPSSDDNTRQVPSTHILCPPDDERPSWTDVETDNAQSDMPVESPQINQPLIPPSDSSPTASVERHSSITTQSKKQMDIDEEPTAPDMLSPVIAETEKQEDRDRSALAGTALRSPSSGYDFSYVRVCDMYYYVLGTHTNLLSSLFRHPHHASCVQVADFTVRSSLSVRYMTFR